MSIKIQNSDGGKIAEGFAHETNDCTVRTLSNSTGLPYKESHRLAKIAGRFNGHGMKKTQIDVMLSELAKGGHWTIREIPVPQPSVTSHWYDSVRGFRRTRRQRVGGITKGDFLRRLPKTGNFYCASTSHAFAVVDGILKDHREAGRCKMVAAWEIIPVYPQFAPVPVETPERLAEMEEMKRKITRLEEMAAMKKRIAELEKQRDQDRPRVLAAGYAAGRS